VGARVHLLSYTPDPKGVVARAARLCSPPMASRGFTTPRMARTGFVCSGRSSLSAIIPFQNTAAVPLSFIAGCAKLASWRRMPGTSCVERPCPEGCAARCGERNGETEKRRNGEDLSPMLPVPGSPIQGNVSAKGLLECRGKTPGRLPRVLQPFDRLRPRACRGDARPQGARDHRRTLVCTSRITRD
jgi:hypothetical protein